MGVRRISVGVQVRKIDEILTVVKLGVSEHKPKPAQAQLCGASRFGKPIGKVWKNVPVNGNLG
jgi:hypothetical protein